MVESLQMFLFLFKSKYRRKSSWFSPFLCSVLIVLLFCNGVLSRCSEHNCLNGACKNETCVCFEGWQGPECQYCGGKVKLTSPTGIITDGPGNYSVSTQCSWLLAPPWLGPTAPVIRIRLESFATECGWDHLYVYDGDSVRAEKLLAVYSGVLDKEESDWTRQVVARSGTALLHFFSDDAYAMEGFNVTYAAYSCPSNDARTNCSSHGECEDGTCKCEPDWVGIACNQKLCPDNCNAEYGAGSCTSAGCECTPSRSGVDCTRDSSGAGFEWGWREEGEAGRAGETRPSQVPPAAAAHVLLRYVDDLLRVGGETFGPAHFLYRYKVRERTWEPITTEGEAPAPRFAHSAVLYGHELLVYGGVVASDDPERGGGLAGLEGRAGEVTNELWRIRLNNTPPQWINATPNECSPHRPAPLKHCGGLHVSGHTAVLAYVGATKKPVMLAFFGHSPHYGYLHTVQEYYIEEGVWSSAAIAGWPARAGFAHSAAYDALSRRVYVHGGLVSESEAAQAPSAALFEYNVETRVWKPLPSAPTPRYLHAAVFVSPGVMLIFGGNAHNDSAAAVLSAPAASLQAKCYSAQPLLYIVRCGVWRPLAAPPGAARAALAAASLPLQKRHTAILLGGFDGRLRSDALLFETGEKCSSYKTEALCLSASQHAAVSCVWKTHEKICMQLEEVGWKESFDGTVKACTNEPVFDPLRCMAAESCAACTAAGCAWCGACLSDPQYCVRHTHQMALSIEECGANDGESAKEACGRFHSCAACYAHQRHHPYATEDLSPRLCYWDYENIKCRPANSSDDIRSVASAGGCSAACSTFRTCANCTAEECIWCASAARCVDKNAYGASFPLGGCRAWSTSGGNSQSCGATHGCSAHVSCARCRAEPACGWCDDGAGGGRGLCMPGGNRRPHAPRLCAQHRWHFTRCPACQCNGHSYCDSQSRCVQPCGGRAIGDHCETCAPGHWGNPLNGGVCTPCECNAQAVACAPDTGRCYCSTKGLAGDRCDKCDNTNHYHADVYNKGACYYDLAVDYQFTFNLSKKEDRHLSAINFRNAPVKPDVDADFSITCSAHARMNLTVRTRADPAERTLFSDVNCTNFRYKFAKSEHAFGVEDNVTLTTFFVYVYDFRPPLWIQISFSQYPKLNLQQFFITFSSCFLLLLLVAAALWKIKQKYDLYRRRQRLFVEMEQMASRPFSQVCVEMERGWAGGGTGVPAPIALEPCVGARAAVLSLLVRLPTGGTGRAPPLGGLAVGSALVTLGQHDQPATKHTHRPL
ncbi:attractin-like protein 1 isoform X2 [Plodia interpunctella]|uniref:attractin-like protein 1 isoform X2 n=1 Tax=Plodia interpunctella TaxID=58824 RepID=UPI00236791F1|nr:attractin-like protein 1 isoform X2 [Plodia interpunctella]